MAEKVYPRIPESNWWALRAQFRKSVPTALTTNYLKTLLNLSDKSALNLMPMLKQINLIDAEGKPTERAYNWRDDGKYQVVCHQLLDEIYPQELRDLFPGADVDRASLRGWFMSDAKVGEAAAKQCAAFYSLLAQAQVKTEMDSLPATKPKASKNNGKNGTKPRGNTPAQEAPTPTVSTAPTPEPAGRTKRQPTLHIDLQVHISPEASVDQIDAIFASMAKHLYDKDS